jgi:hypothetical protein
LAKEGFSMTTRTEESVLETLALPGPFEDLTGVIRCDLKVIVNALAERAEGRLLLSPRRSRELRRALWNQLARAINDTMAPLTLERQ